MRVAVHHPDGAVSAYKFGRIEDGVHNVHAVLGNMPLDDFVEEVVKQAQDEHPNCNVVVERMVLDPNNPEESLWIPSEDFDPDVHQATPVGNQVQSPALTENVNQEAR